MAKISATMTLTAVRDIESVTWYYQLKAGTSAPTKPTVSPPPSPWQTTEPSYTAGDTKYLFVVERTIYTDGTFDYTMPTLSASFEAAKQAYNEAQNAKKVATNYMTDLSNGVYVHANGTSVDPANANAKGVKITDVVDIIRAGQSVGQFGEKIRLGRQDNIHFQIDNNAFGYYVDDVPVSTLTCSYELDGDEDEEYEEVGTKDMELKVVSPVFSNTDKCKASVILHYESGSGKPTYGRLFVQNIDSQLGNMAYVEVREAQADSDVILYSEGTIFKVHGHDKIASLNGSLLVEGMAGVIQMWAGQYAPPGWRICDGSTLGREAFSKLFSVIGTTYGEGDGSTTFNLPDFRDRFPVGAGTTYSRNSKGGADKVTLNTSQIPAHTHGKSGAITNGITGGSHTHSMKSIWSDGSGSNSAYTMSTNRKQTTRTTAAETHTHNLPAHEHTSVGGGQAHENRPPYIGINFIICTGRITV